MRHIAFALAWLLSASISISAGEFLLKPNDHVVIYGDSITEQRLYSRYLQQYVNVRYPEMKIRFDNAGWGGDTALGALRRLERDVLFLKPSVVTLFFGMNDGTYQPLNDTIVSNYRQNLEKLVEAIKEKGVRVIVFTPGCVDYDRQSRLGDVQYNKTLEALARTALEVARKNEAPGIDVFHPMLAFQEKQKAKNSSFTMIPDSVHPDAPGHLVMASIMLQGLGAEKMPPLGAFDLASGNGRNLKRVRGEGTLALETAGTVATPFYMDDSFVSIARECGFLESLGGQLLKVVGLEAGTYRVVIDGGSAGKYSSEELEKGVFLPGAWSERGKQLQSLIERKENSYFSAWREIRLPMKDLAGIEKVVDGLMKANDGYQEMIHHLAMPAEKATLSLPRAPSGPNLALHKKYESSDPNRYNYGVGALTDGSTDAAHVFATGDANQFPKHVTIDLENVASVGAVELTVPSFGSTKTIEISVSVDGQEFNSVGTHQFALGRESTYLYSFSPTRARFVRLTYPDHHPQFNGFSPTFSFTSEVGVYGAQ